LSLARAVGRKREVALLVEAAARGKKGPPEAAPFVKLIALSKAEEPKQSQNHNYYQDDPKDRHLASLLDLLGATRGVQQ
jgi:hypothetical protein